MQQGKQEKPNLDIQKSLQMCYSEMWKSPFKGAVCPIPPPAQSESFLFFKWENKDVN